MSVPADPPLAADENPGSLTELRVAAGIGSIVAIVLVVLAFTVSLWLGLAALFLAPVVPMLFVVALEAARR